MRTESISVHTDSMHTPAPFFREDRLCVDGVCFDNTDAATALSHVHALVQAPPARGASSVLFVNVHTLSVARRSKALRDALRDASLVLPDGSGLALAGRLAGRPVRENLNGTDFTPRVLAEAEKAGYSVYLFGAKEEIIRTCHLRLLEHFPRLNICGVHHGHLSPGEERSVLHQIASTRPDILLVGMGTPAQEIWIQKNRETVGARVCFGIGGLFDFLSGERPRAPRWMRRVGIEWAYRFFRDPLAKWDRVLIEIPWFLTRAVLRRIPVHAATRQPVIIPRGGR